MIINTPTYGSSSCEEDRRREIRDVRTWYTVLLHRTVLEEPCWTVAKPAALASLAGALQQNIEKPTASPLPPIDASRDRDMLTHGAVC